MCLQVTSFATSPKLATQTQTTNQSRVTVQILAFEVVQQLTTLVYHADQAATGVVVFLVSFEVLLQLVDVKGQQGNLYLWRTCITSSLLIVANNLGFFFNA